VAVLVNLLEAASLTCRDQEKKKTEEVTKGRKKGKRKAFALLYSIFLTLFFSE